MEIANQHPSPAGAPLRVFPRFLASFLPPQPGHPSPPGVRALRPSAPDVARSTAGKAVPWGVAPAPRVR